LDRVRNPRSRETRSLTLCYQSKTVPVPVPGKAELVQLRSEVAARVANCQADAAVHQAKPSPNVCAMCEVRHLCDRFWVQMPVTKEARTIDVQVKDLSRRSDTSWDGTADGHGAMPNGWPLLIRASDRFPVLHYAASTGDRIRMLGVRSVAPPAANLPRPATLSLLDFSEVFIVPSAIRI
jgi:hypothetical protein